MSKVSRKADRSVVRGRRTALLAGPLVTVMCVPALAGPEGERVAAGRAEFTRQGSTTTIRAADNTIINYTGFDIASHETVRFVQPGADARVLNRINSPEPTRIDGTLTANGQVFLVNPSGVMFGAGSVVDVGRLYAAAGSISDKDFLAGRNRFSLNGEVVNEGSLRGDSIALMGRRVANFGSLVAPEGTITLAAGDHVLIGERGGHVFAKISSERADPSGAGIALASLENGGDILAADGQVLLAAGDVYALAVHDTSRIRARQVALYGGRDSTVTVSGTIDASSDAESRTGGRVTVTGERVGLFGATVDASGPAGGGEVLIGGDRRGGGELDTAELAIIDNQSVIHADATGRGQGGKVVLWADNASYFGGLITARGTDAESGGFVETSGKRTLRLGGGSVLAPGGTWLLDPTDVTIRNGSGDGAADGTDTFAGDPSGAFGTVLGADTGPTDIFESELEGLAAGVDIVIEATNNITIENLVDNVLDLATTGSVTFTADSDSTGGGEFSMNAGDLIVTQGASLNITGASASLGGVNTNGGAFNVNVGSGFIQQIGAISAGTSTLTGASINLFSGVTTTSGGLTINNSGTLNILTQGALFNITGAFDQTGTGGVVLFRDVTADSVSFAGTLNVTGADLMVDSASTASFAGITTDGSTRSLTVNAPGLTTLGGTINDSLLTLSTDAPGSSSVTGTIVDIASLTFNDPVDIGADVSGGSLVFVDDVSTTGTRTIASTGALGFGDANDDTLTLGGDLTVNANQAASPGNALTFYNVAGGGFLLTANNAAGDTVFSDVSGGLGTLDNLGVTTDAGAGETIINQPITNGQALAFGDAVQLNRDVSGTTVAFNGDVTTTGTRTVTSQAAMSFGDANDDLLTLGGNLIANSNQGGGGGNRLDFFNIDGGGFLVTANNSAGSTIFNDVSGGLDTLEDLSITTDAGGTTQVNQGIAGANNGETLIFNDITTLSASSVVDSATFNTSLTLAADLASDVSVFNGLVTLLAGEKVVTGGSATFNSSVNALVPTTLRLNVNGATTFGTAINSANLSIITDAPGTTAINADILNADALTFNDPVTLSADTSSNSAVFAGPLTVAGAPTRTVAATADATFATIAGSGGGSRSLAVDAGGVTTLGGVINDGNLSITTNAAGSTEINAAIQDADVFTINDDATLNADVIAQSIAFNAMVDIPAASSRLLTSDSIAFGGGAASVTGTGSLSIRPSAAGVGIDIGTVPNPGSGLAFSAASFQALGADLASVTFGFPSIGAHTIQIGAVGTSYESPTTFATPLGSTVLAAPQTAANDGSFTFTSAIRIEEGIGASLTTANQGITVPMDVFGTTGGAAESLSLDAGTGAITLSGLVSGDGTTADATGLDSLTIVNGGTTFIQSVDISGALSTTNQITAGGLTLNTGVAAGSVDVDGVAIFVGGDVDTSAAGGNQAYTGPVTVTGSNRTFDAGTGGITINTGLAGTGFDIEFIGDAVSFAGAAGSVTGTGSLTIRPSDATIGIDIGTVPNPGAGLAFSAASFQAIGAGFSSVVFGDASTGSHTIQVGAVGANHQNPTTFATPNGLTVLAGDQTAAGNGLFVFTSPVRIEEGLDVTLTLADQNLVFPFEVDGTTGGAGESLTIALGTGDLTFQADIVGDAGTMAADATGLADVTFDTANNVTVQAIHITGLLSSCVGGNALTGAFIANGAIEAGSVTMAGSSFQFQSVTTNGESTVGNDATVMIDNSGLLDINGDFTIGTSPATSGAFSQAGIGAVELGGDIDSSAVDGGQSFAGSVTLTDADRILNAGEGTISFADMVNLAGFNLSLIAGDVSFSGGPGAIKDTVGGSSLTLEPDDPTTAIDVGDVATPQPMAFTVDQADLDALTGGGLDGVTIGRADGAHANFQIDDAAFGFNALFRSPAGGLMRILGPTTNSLGGATTTFEALAIDLGASVTTNGPATFTGPIGLVADSNVTTGGGDLLVQSTIDGAFALSLQAFDTGSGDVDVQGIIGATTRLASLDIDGQDVGLVGIGGVGQAGVLGTADVRAGDDLTLAGGLYVGFEQLYAADDEILVNQDTQFFSSGSDLTFTQAGFAQPPTALDFEGIILVEDSSMTVRTAGGNLLVTVPLRNESQALPEGDLDFDAVTGTIDIQGRIGEPDPDNGLFEQVDQIRMHGSTVSVVGATSRRSQRYQSDTTNLSGIFTTTEAGGSSDLLFEPDGMASTAVVLLGDTTLQTAGGAGDDIVFGNPGASEPGTIDGGFSLIATAGDGDVIVEGGIGRSASLGSLSITGTDISLNGIGTVGPMAGPVGVAGVTSVAAGGDLTLRSGGYNALQQTYNAQGAIELPVDTTFMSNGSSLTFGGDGFVRLVSSSLTASTSGGSANFNAEIVGSTGTEDLLVDAGTGRATFDAIGANEVGGAPGTPTIDQIQVLGDEIDFTDSVFGSDISLESSTAGLDIELGGTTDMQSRLDLTVTDLSRLQNGFGSVTIGSASGTNAINILDATFRDPALIQSPGAGGTIAVSGTLRGNQDSSITLRGPGAGTTLQGSILTEGNEVRIEDGVMVAQDSLVDTDAAGMAGIGGGAIAITGPIDGPMGLRLFAQDMDAGVQGDVTLSQDIGTTMPLSAMTVTGDSAFIENIGTDSAVGVSDVVSFTLFDDLVFNGSTFNAGQHLYQIGDEARITQDSVFTATTGSLIFELVGGASADSDGIRGIFLENASDFTANTADAAIATGPIRQEAISGLGADIILDAGTGGITTGVIGVAGMQDPSPATVTATGATISLTGVTTRNEQTYTGDASIVGGLFSLDSGTISVIGNAALADTVQIETAGSDGDDVLISGTLDGTSEGGQALTIDTGAEGDLTIGGPAGSVTRLGDFTIAAVDEVSIAGLDAATIDVTSTGMFQSSGDVSTTADGGMTFDGTTFAFAGNLDAMGDGGIQLEGESITVDGTTAAGDAGVSVMVDANATFTGRVTSVGDGGVTIAERGMSILNDVTLGDGADVGAMGLSITGDLLNLDGLFRTAEDATITLSNQGNLVFGPNSTFDLQGDFLQTTSSPVVFQPLVSGDRTEVVSFGNTIDVAGPVSLGGDALFRGMDVTFQSVVLPVSPSAGALTVRGNGTISLMDDVGSTVLPFASLTVGSGTGGVGTAMVQAGVTTSGNQQYNIDTELLGGTGTSDRQRLDASGAIGFASGLMTLGFTDVVAGTTLLVEGLGEFMGAEQSFQADQGATFRGIVRLDGTTDVVSKRDIVFERVIEGPGSSFQAVAGQLNLLLDADRLPPDPAQLPAAALDTASQQPTIVLMDGVGQSAQLAGLNLNSTSTGTRSQDGDLIDTDVPLTPSIVLGAPLGPDDAVPDIELNTGTFAGGFFEVITANANLTINATDSVALPDMNVLGSLTINSPRIELLSRPDSARVLFSPDGGLQGLTFNSDTTDSGSDIVVAGIERINGSDSIRSDAVLTLNSAPDGSGGTPEIVVIASPGAPSGTANFIFSAPEGEGSLGGAASDALDGFSVLRPFTGTNAQRGNFRVGSVLMNPNIVDGLDLRASGIGENPANTRALAVAASASLADIQQDASAGTLGQEELSQIGINLRDLGQNELIDSIVGFSLYQDLQASRVLGEGASQALVTRNRLDFQLVEDVVRRYDQLFFRRDLGDQGEPLRESRVPSMQAAMEGALVGYLEQTGQAEIDPRGFNQFLATSDLQAAADTAAIIGEVQALLDSVRALGLSPADFAIAKSQIISLNLSTPMGFDAFEAILDTASESGQEQPIAEPADEPDTSDEQGDTQN